jgi:hypothetical protein
LQGDDIGIERFKYVCEPFGIQIIEASRICAAFAVVGVVGE